MDDSPRGDDLATARSMLYDLTNQRSWHERYDELWTALVKDSEVNEVLWLYFLEQMSREDVEGTLARWLVVTADAKRFNPFSDDHVRSRVYDGLTCAVTHPSVLYELQRAVKVEMGKEKATKDTALLLVKKSIQGSASHNLLWLMVEAISRRRTWGVVEKVGAFAKVLRAYLGEFEGWGVGEVEKPKEAGDEWEVGLLLTTPDEAFVEFRFRQVSESKVKWGRYTLGVSGEWRMNQSSVDRFLLTENLWRFVRMGRRNGRWCRLIS